MLCYFSYVFSKFLDVEWYLEHIFKLPPKKLNQHTSINSKFSCLLTNTKYYRFHYDFFAIFVRKKQNFLLHVLLDISIFSWCMHSVFLDFLIYEGYSFPLKHIANFQFIIYLFLILFLNLKYCKSTTVYSNLPIFYFMFFLLYMWSFQLLLCLYCFFPFNPFVIYFLLFPMERSTKS